MFIDICTDVWRLALRKALRNALRNALRKALRNALRNLLRKRRARATIRPDRVWRIAQVMHDER